MPLSYTVFVGELNKSYKCENVHTLSSDYHACARDLRVSCLKE